MVKEIFTGIKNLIIGLFTTGKHFGRKAVTIHYPEEKWTMPERSRGLVVLLSDKETGELNCTTCMLCMRSCPVGAITIHQHKDEETKKRVLDDFVVDHSICCFCGMCEEACNFAAIKLATFYENSTYTKPELIEHVKELQERGRDVPYEKPVRKSAAAKKPVAKKPAPKPAAKPEGAEEAKPAEAEKKAEAPANPAPKADETKKDDEQKEDNEDKG